MKIILVIPMNDLNKLIKKLCPNGIKHVPIKEAYKRVKGTPITAAKMKEISSPEGDVLIIAGGKTTIYAKEEDIPNANITRVPAVLVQSRGIIDVIYYDKPFTFKNEMWAYTTDNPTNVKYLYYVMKNNIEYFRDSASGMGSLPQISLPVTEDFIIPYPPFEIQEEIVRILDSFTALTAELTAELTARKLQYEFYRDKLLSFDDLSPEERERRGVRMMTIGEFSTLIRGNGLQKKDFVGSGIGCIHYGQIYTKFDTITSTVLSYVTPDLAKTLKCVEPGDLIIAATSENIQDVCKAIVWEGKDNIVTGGHTIILKHNQNPRYISYLLQTTLFQKQKEKIVQGTKVIDVSADRLSKIQLPIVPYELQTEIVSKIDQFRLLCNDLREGLPAEIEARRKQYEYYKDKLLSFEEVNPS